MSSKLKLHARRHAARFGNLDQLLVEALKSKPIGEGSVTRIKGIDAAIHETYANPANWDQTGVVQIIYTDERTGKMSTIGTFQELRHRRTAARKLCRVDEVQVEPFLSLPWATEFSNDPYLLGPPAPICPPVAPANPYERQAIRDYLTRTKEVKLDEFLGSKVDAAKLLNELKSMGVVLK